MSRGGRQPQRAAPSAGAAPVPHDERARLARLRAMAVLDSPREPVFDALVRAASAVCGVPIALVSLVDAERQWFKANVGLPGVEETPREVAFCAHAILDEAVMVVPDAREDARFASNPIVTGDPNIRFYAGAPLTTSSGHRVGTLCAIDREPRELTDSQRAILADLADAAVAALEAREVSVGHLAESMAAQERLTALYQATPAMLHSVDTDGRFVSVSDRWLAALGYERDEVVGRPAVEFLTHESAVYAATVVWPALLRNGFVNDVDYQYVCSDGSVMDAQLSAILEYDADGKPLRTMAALEDVTARRRAERQLVESRDRMRNILEGTNAGTWEWNVQTGETRFNERWAEMIGYTLEELEPISIETWARFAHPDDLEASNALIERHLEGELAYYDHVARMRHRDGHWIWVHDRGRVAIRDDDGQPLWMMGTHSDITAIKQVELALAATEVRLQHAQRIANVGGWSVDVTTGEVEFTEQSCRILGLEPGSRPSIEDALARYVPESKTELEGLLNRGRDGQTDPWELDARLVTAQGKERWVRIVGEPEFEGGNLARVNGALQEITERYRAARDLEESRELLQVTLASIADAVITADVDGNVEWLNPAAERMTGWSLDDAVGKPSKEVFHIVNENTGEEAPDPIACCLQEGRVVGLASHTVLVSRDGSRYGVEDSASPISNTHGEVVGAVIVFHDVSEQRRMSREMTYRATHDPLTGLVNRGEFEVRLARVLSQARDHGSTNALMYIDLDQFKIVNDTCGHAVGDQLLRQVTRLLEGCVRKRDTLARLGGDEFGVILEHCAVEQAGRVAQQICDAMDEFRFEHQGKRFRVGASIGLVAIEGDTTESAVLQAADSACYAAKEAGRNRVHMWNAQDHKIRSRQGHVEWAPLIEQALDEDGFDLHVQHILPIGGGDRGTNCEVLLRLRGEDGALIAPGAFLPAAERYQLATRIDRWVLRRVLDWMAAPGRGSEAFETIAVNVSGQSVGDQAFLEFAIGLLDEAPNLRGRLCFEITETAVVAHIADAKRFVSEMRARGVRIALDDFGAGASSFGYLKSLKVDTLKIDGQFIRRLASDALDQVAVRCFADIARIAGMSTVAEYVENRDVLVRLADIGIDYAQGYLLHRPEPLALEPAPARCTTAQLNEASA